MRYFLRLRNGGEKPRILVIKLHVYVQLSNSATVLKSSLQRHIKILLNQQTSSSAINAPVNSIDYFCWCNLFSYYLAFPFFVVNKLDHTLKFFSHCNHFAFFGTCGLQLLTQILVILKLAYSVVRFLDKDRTMQHALTSMCQINKEC